MHSNPPSRSHRHFRAGFTLVELLIVMAIIGILVSLLAPQLGSIRERAERAKCAANLRNLAAAVQSYTVENDNRFPMVETNPSNPVYSADVGAKPILEVLGEYGVTPDSLKCPSDVRKQNWFKKTGSSYEWRPLLDGELVSAPVIYTRRGERFPPLSKIRLVMDFEKVHGGRANLLFADGTVKMN